jgi:hypothetical protein
MMLALSAALLGAVLGMRFDVLALIPAVVCASVVAGAGQLAGGNGLDAFLVQWILLVVCLQLGYVGGAAINYSLSSVGMARDARSGKSASTTSIS